MSAKALLFVTFALFAPALAQAETAAACFANEVDPATRRAYANEDQYRADLEALLQAEPPRPGLYTLYRAYNLSQAETPNAQALKSDKRAHCYIGCRIANDFGAAAAEYAAWYKEHRDLTDCDRRSRFEPQDIVATQVGIRLGETHAPRADKSLCQQQCRQRVR